MTIGWHRFCQTVSERGDRPALLWGEEKISFVGLGRLAAQLAGGMASRGVVAGDRVILHLGNGRAAAALPAALWAIGAVPVLAPFDLRGAALEGIADRVAARGVISETADHCGFAPVWRADMLIGAFRASAGQGDTIGSVVFTSGSTGRPKGVVQRQSTLIDGAARVARAVGFGREDRLLCAVPWSHDYGWTQLLALYVLGITLVLPETPGLAGIPAAIERHRVSVIGGVPSVYAGLTKGITDIAERDKSSVRLVMSTGSAMPQRVWEGMADLLPKARRVLNYGLTETFRSATLRAEDEALAPRVIGTALPGAGLAIVDAKGNILPAGEWGEIVHRGAGVFERYWDDPELTAQRRRIDPVTGTGFAFFTGDRGMLDEGGRLTVGDRIDRMVKVMGLSASPLAIEEVLQAVPGVSAAAVVFRSHDILGAELHAVLVGEGVQKPAEAACRVALAPHERPRRFHLRDRMPLTASGKIDLVQLTSEIAV